MNELDRAVKEAKKNQEWEHEYMTLMMRDKINIEKGEDKLSQLVVRLMEDKRSQDVIKVTQDKEYRTKMYKEYHIDC